VQRKGGETRARAYQGATDWRTLKYFLRRVCGACVGWLFVAGGGAASGDKVRCVVLSMQQQHRRAGRTEYPRPPWPPRAQRSHMSLRGPVFLMPALTQQFGPFFVLWVHTQERYPPHPPAGHVLCSWMRKQHAREEDAVHRTACVLRCLRSPARLGWSVDPHEAYAKNWSSLTVLSQRPTLFGQGPLCSPRSHPSRPMPNSPLLRRRRRCCCEKAQVWCSVGAQHHPPG
jgi:hypothetical protein